MLECERYNNFRYVFPHTWNGVHGILYIQYKTKAKTANRRLESASCSYHFVMVHAVFRSYILSNVVTIEPTLRKKCECVGKWLLLWCTHNFHPESNLFCNPSKYHTLWKIFSNVYYILQGCVLEISKIRFWSMFYHIHKKFWE